MNERHESILEDCREDLILGRESKARERVDFHYKKDFEEHTRNVKDSEYFGTWVSSTLGIPKEKLKRVYERIFPQEVKSIREFALELYQFGVNWIDLFSRHKLA